MAERLRKMNPRGCGPKLSQSSELQHYPDTTGEQDTRSPGQD
jgi:hypothetical protein